MRRFLSKAFLLLLPFAVLVFAELFLLPLDVFTFRTWEALARYEVRSVLPGPFYPEMTVCKIEEGDLGHHTQHAVSKIVTWETDRFGYRKKETAKDRWDILLLGDSNTAGSALSQEETISEVLEKKLKTSLYPLAPASFNTFLRDTRFYDKKPSLVIMLSIERDVVNMKLPKRSAEEQARRASIYRITEPVKENKTVRTAAIVADRIAKANMLNYYRAEIRRMFVRETKAQPKAVPMLFMHGAAATEQVTSHVFETSVRSLCAYDSLLKRRGIRFIFVPIPDKETVYYDLIPGGKRRTFIPELVAELKRRKIEALDTQAAFEEAARDRTRLLYHKDDTHWNARGVEVTAELIARYLRSGPQGSK